MKNKLLKSSKSFLHFATMTKHSTLYSIDRHKIVSFRYLLYVLYENECHILPFSLAWSRIPFSCSCPFTLLKFASEVTRLQLFRIVLTSLSTLQRCVWRPESVESLISLTSLTPFCPLTIGSTCIRYHTMLLDLDCKHEKRAFTQISCEVTL